jgi:mono/diheme cytochrome c family protein
VSVIIGFVSLTYLNGFKDMPRTNKAFNYQAYKKEQVEKQKVLDDIEKARLAALEPKEEVKVQKPVFKVDLNTEGLIRGHKLYAKCIVCHGKLGEGKKSQNSPKVGGQFDWYIVSQIKAMKSGTRENKVMNPYIRKLSAQDIKDLGEYIAKLPW